MDKVDKIDKIDRDTYNGLVVVNKLLNERITLMLDDEAFLAALMSCGVDNWVGYEDAQAMMEDD